MSKEKDMDIEYLDRKAGRDRLKLTQNGNSDAISVPDDFGVMTVILSAVTGGSAKVQYSLADKDSVSGDTASWHDWSVGDVTSDGGTSFNSPIAYIRVVSSDSTNYTLEVLS